MVLADEEAYEDLDVRWRLLRKLPVDSEAWLRRAIWRASLGIRLGVRPRSLRSMKCFWKCCATISASLFRRFSSWGLSRASS